MTWTPTNTTAEWGQVRVRVDDQDRTWFRDQLTVVGGWQDTDPYGSNNATLVFPQVTEFDELGVGELDWLVEGAKVRIDHHNDGALVKNLFVGIIDRIETGGEITVTCTGHLTGYLAMRLHQPPIGRRKVRDAGTAIWHEIGAHDGMSRFDVNDFTTGEEVAVRGDRAMTQLGFVDYCLGMAVKADGRSLTILPNPAEGANAYVMGWRDLTTRHATVHAGAHGVKVRLSKDLLDNPNRVFGEGMAPNGERWRNAKYPNLGKKTVPPYPYTDGRSFGLGTTNADTDTGDGITVMAKELIGNGDLDADLLFTDVFDAEVEDAVKDTQEGAGLAQTGVVTPALWDIIYAANQENQSFAQAHFAPLAQDKRTHPYLRAGDGTMIGFNPDHDPHVQHVETFVSYGEGTSKRRAKRNARALINRGGGWAGTITLTSDPAECSRFDIRAGWNVKVEHLKGALNQLLHISSVQVDWQSGSVTLAVSTQGRHYLDLATRKERDREPRRDPGLAFRHQLRRSAQTSDAISGWEGESGAGIVRPTPLIGGQWNVIPVVAAELGTLGRIRLETDAPTLYWCALFADRVNEGVLNNRLGDPSLWVDADKQVDVFTHNADWLVEDERLMVTAWGTPDQPCGLWPKPYLKPDGETRTAWPINGLHRDDQPWDFWTANNWLYLAVWPQDDTVIRGRARIQLNEGV